MNPTADTKVHDLVERYPYLLDFLAGYAPEFAKLKNPVLYNTVARVATLEAAAKMADTSLESLLDELRTQIATHEIIAEETAGTGGAPAVDPALRLKRQEKLKEIIRRLHDGADVSEVKADFDALATAVDSLEIATMEQALIAEGMPVADVQRLCDVHVSVFKESLEAAAAATPSPTISDDHPVALYERENRIAEKLVVELRAAVSDGSIEAISTGLERLAPLATHYRRKENQLFPALERHGIEGPTKVMWGLDDDIIGRLKTAGALARSGDAASLRAMLPELLTMIDDMIYKEEKILFPTALQVITDAEWQGMAAGDAEIGYAWIEGPAVTATPSSTETGTSAHADAEGPMLLPLPTGALSLEQLDLMLRALPFDVSYVDEHDRVRFYSEGERVFPRSPGAIGREVRNCHPPASLEKVEEILAAFKAGEKDSAEFWIEIQSRFIHIRYLAMRDAGGEYKGCLEVVHDATHVRTLEGQRRLVNW